jgi:hypothetical protein
VPNWPQLLDRVPVALLAWPHDPGWSVISDYDFGDVLPVGTSQPIGSSGWNINNGGGLASRISDASAPLSPPFVGQWHYPIGFADGGAPATMYRDPGATPNVYWGLKWKMSNPFQTDSSGVNKIHFLWTASGTTDLLYLDVTPVGGGVWNLRVQNDLIAGAGPSAGLRLNPQTPTAISPGSWYTIEWLVQYSTGANSDGVCRWWVNGALNGDYTNLKMVQDGGFIEMQISPTYGGNVGDLKTEDDYFWFDHSRLTGHA